MEENFEKKAEEYLNNWKRERAAFLNYKKDEVERAGLVAKFAKEDMFENLLPILDSIYLMEKHGQVEGIDLVKKQIEEFLKKEEIEEIKVEGQPFNPETMEAVGEADQMEELQKGYIMNGKVLRAAKVKINNK